jgi:hypothetical protein
MQMRRFVSFSVAFGITFTAFEGIVLPRPANGPQATATRLTAHLGPAPATAARPAGGLKSVQYAGYTIRVPASWPVYRLDRDPGQCVRYDGHAVYLRRPGASQRCPAYLVGRTATVSLQAGHGTAASAGAAGGAAFSGPAVGHLPQVVGDAPRTSWARPWRAAA